MTPHIHTLTHRHHDLYTHKSLSLNLDADLDALLQGSSEEGEVGCVIAAFQLEVSDARRGAYLNEILVLQSNLSITSLSFG
jgi:hypothetical protein